MGDILLFLSPRKAVRWVVTGGAAILAVTACSAARPQVGTGNDPVMDVLLPGSSLLIPPPLQDSAVDLLVLRRGATDTVAQQMARVRREQRAVSAEPGQVMLTSTWSPPPYNSADTVFIERRGLAPIRERLFYRGAYQYQYSRNHVTGTVQRQDSAARAVDQTFPRNVFAFSEVDLLIRSLPFRRGLRVIVPLFSESDADLEMDTVTVVGPDTARGSVGDWVVRFADPAIVERYVVHAPSREIVSNEITQKRTGAHLRFVATPAAAGT